ncbi:succinylglutamate desuccinylase [Halobacteriales archaeon QS_1_68_17]|nr:MAG: succinylglutamate desuccinylase [Halobacteriales archaeon QS_1_68_17]
MGSTGHESGAVTLATLPSGMAVTTRLHRYEGTADGPTVYIQGAQHGRELNGTDVLRRLHDRLDPDEMRGRVLAVPVANPLAFDNRSYLTPRRLDAMHANMNRVWPGDEAGSLVERMAATLWEYVADADAVVDLHTGSPETAAHVVYMADHDRSRALSRAFDVDLLLGERVGEDAPAEWDERSFDGKLRTTATLAGIPAVTPELGDSRRLDEAAVETGVAGVERLLRMVGVLPGGADPPDGHTLARNHLGRVEAAHSGLFRPDPSLAVGADVGEGDRLGVVYGPSTYETLETVRAGHDGVLYAVTRQSTVVAGERVASVALRD